MRHAADLPPDEFYGSDRETPFSPDYEPVFEAEGAVAPAADPLRRRRPSRRPRPRAETEAQALLEAPPGHEPDESLESLAALGLDRLVDLVDGLPEDERRVVEAHIWEQLSFADIATDTGTSKTSVQRTWNRALRRLRAELGVA